MGYTTEDVIKLSVKTEGEAEVQRLSQAFQGNVERITELRANLAALDAAHKQGTVSAPQLAAAQAAAGAYIGRQAAAATEAADAIKKLGGATGAMRNAGQAAMQVNFALQDLVQGGAASTLNNLPGTSSPSVVPPGWARRSAAWGWRSSCSSRWWGSWSRRCPTAGPGPSRWPRRSRR